VIFAAVQSDMKRLLAWSSIENIGILVAAFGLTLIFYTDGKGALAALTLTAMLYHALNHAFFKGLLFIGTGSVLHATGVRHMGRLGGLMRFMPWTAWLTLIGALAIAGLPPLNGFRVGMAAAAGFSADPRPDPPLPQHVIPVAARRGGVAAALAAYVMVKFFRRRVSRPAARPGAAARARRPVGRSDWGCCGWLRLCAAGPVSRTGHRLAVPGGAVADQQTLVNDATG